MQSETGWTTKDTAAARTGQEMRQAMSSLIEVRHAEPFRLTAAPQAIGGNAGQRQFGPPEVVRGCR
jgi:hypothetical protein